MDTLLIDIKNFLKKLENGQLDIEAGQWELHKDIANMKRSVEELKKLKEDVEVLRMDNAEQMEVIKKLEAKLECLNKLCKAEEPVTVSESSVEYETVYRRPVDGQQASKGYKKRKCHLVRSEEIIEITSEISDKKSSSDNEVASSKTNASALAKPDDNSQPSDDNCSPGLHKKHVHINPAQNPSNVRYQSHPPPANAILQRYLRDSAKYRDRNLSASSVRTAPVSGSSSCDVSHRDTEYNNFWDDYSSRLPPPDPYRSRKGSPPSTNTTESVIPKRLICPKNVKKFAFKSDFPDQERRSRSVKHIYHCKVCGKGFTNKNLLRAHKANHVGVSRKTKGFKCSYCDKICSTPEKLTLHLKNCRIIMRSHFKRR